LVCDAFAIPPPKTVKWSFDKSWLPVGSGGDGGGKYDLKEQIRADGILSTLTIRNVGQADWGKYNCSVDNGHGEASFTIALDEEGPIVFALALTAIVGGVVLSLAAVLLTLVCRGRRCASASSGEKNHHHGYATSSSSSKGFRSSNGRTTTDASATADASKLAGTSEDEWTARQLDTTAGETDGEEADEATVMMRGTNGKANVNQTQGMFPQPHSVIDAASHQGFPADAYSHYANFYPPHHLAAAAVPGDPVLADAYGLNVADPRFAARYGNPYLVQQPVATYATLGARGSPARQMAPSPRGKRVNYAGTMLGNGSLGRNGGVQSSQPTASSSSPSARYIVSPPEQAAAANSGLNGASLPPAAHV